MERRINYQSNNRYQTNKYQNNNPNVYAIAKPYYTNELYGNCSSDPCKKLHIDACVLDQKYSFFLIKLISNRLNYARYQDPNLVNPWGSVYSNNILWIANNQSGLITSYGPTGNKLDTEINVVDSTEISRPTALAENRSNGFSLTNENINIPGSHNNASSFLLVATDNGVISGFSPRLGINTTIKCIDKSQMDASFKGLCISNGNLYATDFYNKTIDVFDSSFNKMIGFDFLDISYDKIPSSYAPFNIVVIDNCLYVSYAQQNPLNNKLPLFGSGSGYINVFTLGGIFIKRLVSGGHLNAPWGIVQAPKSANFPIGTVLVGNNGDGIINIYDMNGFHMGKLTDMNGSIVQISGLWSLTYQNSASLYFTSGPSSQTDGLAGSLSK